MKRGLMELTFTQPGGERMTGGQVTPRAMRAFLLLFLLGVAIWTGLLMLVVWLID